MENGFGNGYIELIFVILYEIACVALGELNCFVRNTMRYLFFINAVTEMQRYRHLLTNVIWISNGNECNRTAN